MSTLEWEGVSLTLLPAETGFPEKLPPDTWTLGPARAGQLGSLCLPSPRKWALPAPSRHPRLVLWPASCRPGTFTGGTRGLVCWPRGPESPGNVCGLRKECSQLAGGRRRHESEVIFPADMVWLYICGDVGVPRCLRYPPWRLRGQWGGGEGSRLRSSRTCP